MLRFALLVAAIAAVITGQPRTAFGEFFLDPEPPMSWDGLLACELAVVAKYSSHAGQELQLEIVEALKGDARAGQTLKVKLEHLYTVETGRVGWDRFGDRGVDDGIPKLCYKGQIINPGDLVPPAVRSDARQPAIYFFSTRAQPVLRVRHQVHSPLFKEGWKQTLAGKPGSVLFRLTQGVNGDISRDALEELGQTREAAAIEQLFDWVLNPIPEGPAGASRPEQWLARIGDQQGDVYGRAAALVREQSPGKNEYRFYALARLMALTDQARAADDLPQLLASGNPLDLRRAALSGLGHVPDRQVALLVCECLRDPDLAESAVHAMRNQLRWDQVRGEVQARGRIDEAWLLDQLRAALRDEAVGEETKKRIRSYFGHVLADTPVLDLELLRKRLSNPDDPTYHGRADGTTSELLKQARQACDPRVIPILGEALANVPEASGNHAYQLQETLEFYATICPRAMRKELEARGLPGALAAIPMSNRSFKIRKTMEAAQVWPPEFSRSQAELDRCFELAKQVREGGAEAKTLLAAVSQFIEKHGQSPFAYSSLRALLESQSSAAEARFFEHLAESRRSSINRWTGEPSISLECTYLLGYVYSHNKRRYFEEILGLLRSSLLRERQAGVESLVYTLQTDFGFDPEALAAERRQLAAVELRFQELSTATEVQSRIIYLQQAGLALEGEPGDAWLKTLASATTSQDQHTAANALRLIESIVGEPRCREFGRLPVPQRTKAVTAYLQDAGRLGE